MFSISPHTVLAAALLVLPIVTRASPASAPLDQTNQTTNTSLSLSLNTTAARPYLSVNATIQRLLARAAQNNEDPDKIYPPKECCYQHTINAGEYDIIKCYPRNETTYIYGLYANLFDPNVHLNCMERTWAAHRRWHEHCGDRFSRIYHLECWNRAPRKDRCCTEESNYEEDIPHDRLKDAPHRYCWDYLPQPSIYEGFLYQNWFKYGIYADLLWNFDAMIC